MSFPSEKVGSIPSLRSAHDGRQDCASTRSRRRSALANTRAEGRAAGDIWQTISVSERPPMEAKETAKRAVKEGQKS